jgi:hypothetical protein
MGHSITLNPEPALDALAGYEDQARLQYTAA